LVFRFIASLLNSLALKGQCEDQAGMFAGALVRNLTRCLYLEVIGLAASKLEEHKGSLCCFLARKTHGNNEEVK